MNQTLLVFCLFVLGASAAFVVFDDPAVDIDAGHVPVRQDPVIERVPDNSRFERRLSPSSTPTELVPEVRRRVWVRGFVVDPSGHPAVGVMVSLHGKHGGDSRVFVCRTDRLGRYRILVPEGSYSVVAESSGHVARLKARPVHAASRELGILQLGARQPAAEPPPQPPPDRRWDR